MNVLDVTKANLQLNYTTHQDDYLKVLIGAAITEIIREGVETLALEDGEGDVALSPDAPAADVNLVAMYAAYLYRLRAATSVTADSSNNKYFATTSNNQGIMPHMLRRTLNNRIFQDKARSSR